MILDTQVLKGKKETKVILVLQAVLVLEDSKVLQVLMVSRVKMV